MAPLFKKKNATLSSQPSPTASPRSSLLDRIALPRATSFAFVSPQPFPSSLPQHSVQSTGLSSSSFIVSLSSQLPAQLTNAEIKQKREAVGRKLRTIRRTNAVFRIGQDVVSVAASAVSAFGGLAIVECLSLVEKMLVSVEDGQVNILDVLALIERAGKVVDIVAKGSVEFTSMLEGGVGGEVDPTSATPVARLLDTLRETLAYLGDSARNDGVFHNLVWDAFKDKQTLADFREQLVDALGDFNLECAMATINFQRNTTNDLRAVRQMVELLYKSNIDSRVLRPRRPSVPHPIDLSGSSPWVSELEEHTEDDFATFGYSELSASKGPAPVDFDVASEVSSGAPSEKEDVNVDVDIGGEMKRLEMVLKEVLGVEVGFLRGRKTQGDEGSKG